MVCPSNVIIPLKDDKSDLPNIWALSNYRGVAGVVAWRDADETVDSNLLDGASVPIQLVGSSGDWIDRIGYGIADMSVATSPIPVVPPVSGGER